MSDKKINVNLHTHSIYSDGSSTPEELIKIAVNKNTQLISLNDHNNIFGLKKFMEAAKKFNVNAIPGIEFSCDLNSYIHLTAYGIDYNDSKIIDYFNKKFEKLVNVADIDNIAMNDLMYYDITISEKSVKYTIKDAVKLVHDFGALVFIAHPILTVCLERQNDLIAEFKSIGVDGVEVYSLYNKLYNVPDNFFCYLADKYDMLKSAGTDFHNVPRLADNFNVEMKESDLQWAINLANKYK